LMHSPVHPTGLYTLAHSASLHPLRFAGFGPSWWSAPFADQYGYGYAQAEAAKAFSKRFTAVLGTSAEAHSLSGRGTAIAKHYCRRHRKRFYYAAGASNTGRHSLIHHRFLQTSSPKLDSRRCAYRGAPLRQAASLMTGAEPFCTGRSRARQDQSIATSTPSTLMAPGPSAFRIAPFSMAYGTALPEHRRKMHDRLQRDGARCTFETKCSSALAPLI